MKKYLVAITREEVTAVFVEAANEQEATYIANNLLRNGEVEFYEEGTDVSFHAFAVDEDVEDSSES